MKKIFFFFVILNTVVTIQAQNVGIGTTAPKAKLEIVSTNSGILIPRLTSTARNAIVNPPKSLLVFDSTANQFYYFNGGAWQSINPGSGGGVNSSGWGSSNDANGDGAYKATFPDAVNRIVFINSPYMGKQGYNGVFKSGGLNIQNPSNGIKADFITIDGQSIQARYKDDNALNPYGDEYESNLIINKFGGNMGINTGTPTSPLSFPNVLGKKISFWNASANNDFGIGIQSGEMQFYTAGQDIISFGWGSSASYNRTMAYYPGSAQLGINCLPQAGYHLAVRGLIKSQEIVVELANWADYVFDNNYTLKPLAEVEQYIKENKHLPNIPSASDIKQNGLKVGELQNKMMEKIEELTLYIIELRKEIDLLKHHN